MHLSAQWSKREAVKERKKQKTAMQFICRNVNVCAWKAKCIRDDSTKKNVFVFLFFFCQHIFFLLIFIQFFWYVDDFRHLQCGIGWFCRPKITHFYFKCFHFQFFFYSLFCFRFVVLVVGLIIDIFRTSVVFAHPKNTPNAPSKKLNRRVQKSTQKNNETNANYE